MILTKINTAVIKLEKGILIVLLSVMMVLGLMQIFSRFVIQRPITWSEAMLTYMFVWSSYVAVSLGVQENIHFSVDVVVRKLNPRWQYILSIVCAVLLVGFSLFLIKIGFFLVDFNKDQLMPAMPYAMSWPYLALPICGIFSLVHSVNKIYELIREGEKS